MRHVFSTLAASAALALSMVMPHATLAQGRGADEVCVYEHANYGGFERCYGVGEEIRDLGDLRNRISSIRIRGRAEITLYQHPGFQGREITFDESVPELKQVSRFWNDEADSLRVSRAGFRGRPDPDRRRADRVCVYKHAGFQGDSRCWDLGDEEPDLRRIGWNDKISSVRVFGAIRVALYEHGNFEGQRLILDADVADLSQVRDESGRGNWNDRISSIRVGGERRGRR